LASTSSTADLDAPIFRALFGQEQDTWQFTGAVDGSVDLGDSSLFWDAIDTYADNKALDVPAAHFRQQTIGLASLFKAQRSN